MSQGQCQRTIHRKLRIICPPYLPCSLSPSLPLGCRHRRRKSSVYRLRRRLSPSLHRSTSLLHARWMWMRTTTTAGTTSLRRSRRVEGEVHDRRTVRRQSPWRGRFRKYLARLLLLPLRPLRRPTKIHHGGTNLLTATTTISRGLMREGVEYMAFLSLSRRGL